jgi:methionine aminopeptidase
VIELSSKQALEKCHQTLVAGLQLIQPDERVMAIAAALQEVEAREKRLYAAVVSR